jgi:drug/metabolite transporter (DMT)-like permease
MVYLLLSILSSTVIFVTFKVTERFKTNLIKLITVNYLIAALLGFSFNRYPVSVPEVITSKWLPFALLIGFSFILMFFLIGYSTRHSGVAVTTIAAKMSVVIPVLFSILYFSEETSVLKITGLTLAAVAVFLTSYQPVTKRNGLLLTALPLVIFFGTGIIDSILKYAQTNYIPNKMSLLFPAMVFLTALITGLAIILLNPKPASKSITLAELTGGTILGIANFGSLYFFIRALNSSGPDSSVIFGLNSICIVLFSVFIGSFLFKEKFSKLNLAGAIMAVTSILILMVH